MSTISSAVEKLRDPEYRKAFVASQINVGIPFQIRALLKARGITQDWLAKKTGMLQPRISGLMTPGKTHPNIETLRRVAEAFDCGLAVRFVPFTELAEWSERFDPETFKVPDFDTEMALMEDKEPEAAAIWSRSVPQAAGQFLWDANVAANQILPAWDKPFATEMSLSELAAFPYGASALHMDKLDTTHEIISRKTPPPISLEAQKVIAGISSEPKIFEPSGKARRGRIIPWPKGRGRGCARRSQRRQLARGA